MLLARIIVVHMEFAIEEIAIVRRDFQDFDVS